MCHVGPKRNFYAYIEVAVALGSRLGVSLTAPRSSIARHLSLLSVHFSWRTSKQLFSPSSRVGFSCNKFLSVYESRREIDEFDAARRNISSLATSLAKLRCNTFFRCAMIFMVPRLGFITLAKRRTIAVEKHEARRVA